MCIKMNRKVCDVIGTGVHLLLIQIYCCKDDRIAATYCVRLCFDTYSACRKMFQVIVIDLSRCDLCHRQISCKINLSRHVHNCKLQKWVC